MSNIEDLVRQSLNQRAEDVQPTPALWREVEQRVARRRRLQLAMWSLAGAAAVVAAVLVVPAIVSSPDPTPEVEPLPPGPTEPEDEATTDDEPADDADPVEEPVDEVEPAPGGDAGAVEDVAPVAALPEPALVAAGRRIELIGPAGRTEVLEMDPEGESWIMGIAVRPGSTVNDYTAAVLTTAEGMWDLRHLHVVDGELVTWEPFPELQHRPYLSHESVMGAAVTGPVFSPDGDALAWLEGPPDDLTLRTIGWSNGPGTGARATDNAAFAIEVSGSAAGLTPMLHDWAWSSDTAGAGRSAIVATMDEPTAAAWYIPLTRQADGAWSQSPNGPAGGISTDVGVTEDGATYAVHGTIPDGAPEWMVRLEDGGLVLYHDPFGDQVGRDTRTTALPDDLMAAEGFPTLWVRSIGDQALVGSASTSVAYLVGADGEVARLPWDVAHAAVVR